MIDRLANHCQSLFDLSLSLTQRQALDYYLQELITWNTHTNLTAIREPEEIIIKHFLDSLSVLTVMSPIHEGHRVIDIGTGAGFPGLPIKIIHPEIQLTLVDSVGKKTAFLDHVVHELVLENVSVLTERAETLGQDNTHREGYDWVLARAVAHLSTLSEYLLPLCRVGGTCIAMKGESAEHEADEAQNALDLLGGRISQISAVALPGIDIPHFLIPIKKEKPTPEKYPRRVGLPSKRPL